MLSEEEIDKMRRRQGNVLVVADPFAYLNDLLAESQKHRVCEFNDEIDSG